MAVDLPRGYSRLLIGGAQVVAADHVADELREILRTRTIYAFAEHHPQARALAGRGVAFAVPIGNERVVVRHNRHGGLLARVKGDLFLHPTRAPFELRVSERLSGVGIKTPKLLGFVVYRAFGPWRRADVVTREVPGAFDLGHALLSPDVGRREAALGACADLIRGLGRARVRHRDLNVKNVLLERDRSDGAWLLDLDRVRFQTTDPTTANLSRLIHSARRWQRERGAAVTDAELGAFRLRVLGSLDHR